MLKNALLQCKVCCQYVIFIFNFFCDMLYYWIVIIYRHAWLKYCCSLYCFFKMLTKQVQIMDSKCWWTIQKSKFSLFTKADVCYIPYKRMYRHFDFFFWKHILRVFSIVFSHTALLLSTIHHHHKQ